MDLKINTQRLRIQPFTLDFLEDYCREFTPEVTRYQYPDPFPDRETARKALSGFVEDMERGDMLEKVITESGKELLLQTYRIYARR